MGRTFAIGDIHGCLDKLGNLIEKIDPGEDDTLVFVGDYIDRGPDSRGVVDYLIALSSIRKCIFLRGNHEDMLIDFLEFGSNRLMYFANGGLSTVSSYLDDANIQSHYELVHAIPEKHRDFLAELRWSHEDESHVYVHAGIKPGVILARQDHQDLIWIRNEFIFRRTEIQKKVIFGHTPFPRPFVKPDKIGIDTGAVYGGNLTAVELPGERFIHSGR